MSKHINTDKLAKYFERKLDGQAQSRMILSGRFGIGKTTFIKNYFQNRQQYFHVHLFPVNYSVARNEDIFELIKHDILYELINAKEVNLEVKDINWIQSLTYLDGDDLFKILSSFLLLIPRIGKDIHEIVNELKSLLSVLKAGKKKHEKESDLAKLIEFVSHIEGTRGSIYEHDFYTKLIASYVDVIKRSGRRVILTIDDMDRIDPEHIFRILNVFAAHFDVSGDSNKFGIDQVLIVCDLDNIKKIFHHRYGANVDFSGYISKFYSKDVFYYLNVDNSINIVDNLFTYFIDISSSASTNVILHSDSLGYKTVLFWFIKTLIQIHELTPRELFRVSGAHVVREVNFQFPGHRSQSWRLPLFVVFEFLLELYGNIESFINSMSKVSFDKVDQKLKSGLLSETVLYERLATAPSGVEVETDEFMLYDHGVSPTFNYNMRITQDTVGRYKCHMVNSRQDVRDEFLKARFDILVKHFILFRAEI